MRSAIATLEKSLQESPSDLPLSVFRQHKAADFRRRFSCSGFLGGTHRIRFIFKSLHENSTATDEL
jgi:hypothetical protein